MTNGPGKSDRPTVPEKSPNNAGQPAAEGMEGRGLAKGNLPQQNASRTPSREDASSAMERVRQAASKDKKLRFTALLHCSREAGKLSGEDRTHPMTQIHALPDELFRGIRD
jgi:hypothetical protein